MTRDDLVMVRKAMHQGWPVPRKLRRRLMHRVMDAAITGPVRLSMAAAWTAITANQVNIDAERRLFDLDYAPLVGTARKRSAGT